MAISSGSGVGILFRLGVMDGVITVGSSGGAGLVGIWAGVGSGSGVGVAHGSRPGAYGSATGAAGGGAFLVQVACRGLGDLGLGREGERRCSSRCSVASTRLFIVVGPAAGGGDDHITVWSGCRDWFVPTEAVVELFIDVGHV